MNSKFFNWVFVMFVAMTVVSCGGESSSSSTGDSYSIKGIATNYPSNTKVILQKIENNRPVSIDTSDLDAKGNFELTGKIEEKGFGRLLVGRNDVFMLLENGNYNIDIDRTDPRNYTVSGPSEMNRLIALNSEVKEQRANRDYFKNYVDTVSSPYLAYYALQFMNIQNDLPLFEKTAARISNDIPNSTLAKDFGSFVAQNKEKIAMKAKADAKTKVGSEAPDIVLANLDGKDVSLSSLRGKVVLIDFWASWCGPCRRENPNVVKTYKKYKNKGFEVYSVSLDSNKQRWMAAIEKDGLIWDAHVSDLKKWSSQPVGLYGVNSIPRTFLIDRDGKIIAKNLRGPALENKIKEVLGA